MENLYNKASLVLTPQMVETGKVYSMKPEDRKGDFTFSRSTAATRVGPTGLVEKETQNTAEHSNNFNQWSNKTNASLTSGQFGYDGSSDAWLLQATAATFSYIYDIPTINTGIRTRSVYAKAGTHSTMTFLWASFNQSHFATFDLSNGTFTNANCLADIEDVGNGWYRCISTITDASNTYAALISLSDETGSAATIGDNIYIQDFQQEAGLVARDYIETTTTAIYGGITDNVPRLDHTDSSCPALLLEPQRTNLSIQSEYITGSGAPLSIQSAGMTISYNQTTSPEGVDNAMKWTEASNNGLHWGGLNLTGTSVGDDLTISIFAKRGTSDDRNIIINIYDGATSDRARYNLDAGTIGTDSAASNQPVVSMEDYGNGWWRCIYTRNLANSGYNAVVGLVNGTAPSWQGNGTSNIYTYGLQYEVGSYATSYIPTYGSAVTRNADDTSLTGVSDLIGQTEGTMFFEGSVEHTPENVSIMNFDRSTQYSVSLLKASNDKINAFVYNGGSFLFNIVSTAISGRFKCAVAYKSGDTAFYVNGTQIGVNTTTFTPAATLDDIYIGSYLTPYFAYDHPVECNQALVFKTRLSNEELAALTTI